VRLTPLLDRWSDDPAFAELLGGLDPQSGTPRPEVLTRTGPMGMGTPVTG
jgi:hypothetical protein